MSHKHQKSPKATNMPNLELVGTKPGKDASAKLEDIDIQQLTAISAPMTKRINALKNEQVKLLDLESKFHEELHELECKYAKLYEPIFEKRRKIVIGELEPSEEEGKWALDDADESKKEEGSENKASSEAANGEKDATKSIDEAALTESGKKLLNDLKAQFGLNKDTEAPGIPNFWLETLQALRITSEMIQEHDEPVLGYLQDIRVKMHDKKPYGYTLEFEFGENPYFTNKVLTKTYELKTEVDKKDPFSYEGSYVEKAIGCKIDWKPNKNVTVKLIKKKLKGRNKKAPPKIVTKEEKQDSFFTFFETHKAGEKPKSGGRHASESGDSAKQVAVKATDNHPDDDDDDDDLDEEAAHDFYLMADFETGQYIKEKVIPKAVLYYTGELDDLDDEDDYDEEDYDEGDEDDEDEEDEDSENDDDKDDDDDDDDDEEDNKGGKKGPGAKGGKKGGKPSGNKGGNAKPGEPTPSECKQT